MRLSKAAALKLIHELEVHQIELEVLNRDLMQANAALKIETEKNTAVNINDQNPLSGFNETLLSSLPYPAMYIRRKDRVVLAVNKIAAELGVKPGGYCWREFQKEENISEEEKKIAALYPDVVPSQFNIKCAFCRSDQCFSEVAEQNIAELHAFGQMWNTYWIKVSDDVFLHYAVNITEDNQIERINYARLHLFDFAENHTLDELLEETLNQAETITGSLIGFFHFVEEDQKNLTLQNWSTRTKKDYCRAEGKGMNYEITLAGVWVDCIRERHAVIHNDYSSLEHKKGLPPGHAAVIREMVVPVIRGSKIMAIVGVGNKPTNYNEKDLEVVSLFADLAWDIAERKRAENKLLDEQAFRNSIESSLSSGIAVVDDEGRQIYVNPSFCKMIGWSAKELTGKTPPYVYWPTDEHQAIGEAFQLTPVNKAPTEGFELVFMRKDGVRIPVQVIISPFYDGFKRTGWLANVLDISERKRTEEALRASKDYLDKIINTVASPIFVKNDSFQFILVNDALCALLGVTAEEIIGKTGYEHFPKEQFDGYIANDKELFETGNENISEELVTDGHGKLRTLITTKTPYTDPAGNKFLVGVTSDITERKKAELEIKLKNDELQKINAEKDKFFSIIAHDLRGPFSEFMGLTDLLAEGCANMTSDEIQKIGELLRGSASNLFGLLENLLSWSRMQRGIMPFEPVSQVLKSKVEEGMALVIEGALKKEITIRYEIKEELIAFADSNMLLAIIRNLAFNAVKFTPRGGNITISAKERANHLVEISVKDTGIGMDQFKIDNLFRLDINSSRKGTEGEISTGLGLILCKDFVEKHGGKLWVESIENIGSTFYFTLPAKE